METMKMVKEKKEFAWDAETRIGEFGDDKSRHEVFITELNDKTYVQATKYVQTKAGEKRAKNFTMPLDNFDQLYDIVSDWKLKGAFGSTTELQAPPKAQPVMKGKKRTLEDKVRDNKNFAHLPPGKQELLLDEAERMDDEYGMVTIGVTKTNFMVEYGMNAAQAIANIERKKGFSRAAFTHLG
jgi:hypothetical protein